MQRSACFHVQCDICMQCIEAAGGGGCSTLADQSHVQSRGTQETLFSSHHGPNLTPDPSNKAESLSLRDQHLMLLKINYFSTVDINSILEQKPFRQTEVAESVQLTSHPLGCSLSPSAWTSPQHGRKQTIWPLTWIQPLSRTFF